MDALPMIRKVLVTCLLIPVCSACGDPVAPLPDTGRYDLIGVNNQPLPHNGFYGNTPIQITGGNLMLAYNADELRGTYSLTLTGALGSPHGQTASYQGEWIRGLNQAVLHQGGSYFALGEASGQNLLKVVM